MNVSVRSRPATTIQEEIKQVEKDESKLNNDMTRLRKTANKSLYSYADKSQKNVSNFSNYTRNKGNRSRRGPGKSDGTVTFIEEDKQAKQTNRPRQLLHYQESPKEAISDWEAMQVAKHFPGRYNVQYVNSLNQLNAYTGLVYRQVPIRNVQKTVDPWPWASAPLGTNTYTVVLFAPQMSAFYGVGGGDNFGTTVKLGGTCIFQTDLTSTAVALSIFQQPLAGAFSMADIYGNQGTSIAEWAFIWSSQLDIHLNAPLANRSGRVYIGTAPWSTMFDSSDGVASQTVQSLIGTSRIIRDINGKNGTQFRLRNAVVDNQLITYANANLGETEVTNAIGSEAIVYAIIESPFQNITTGALSAFTMDLSYASNFAYYPRMDAFARNVGEDSMEEEFGNSFWKAGDKIKETIKNVNEKLGPFKADISRIIKDKNMRGTQPIREPLIDFSREIGQQYIKDKSMFGKQSYAAQTSKGPSRLCDYYPEPKSFGYAPQDRLHHAFTQVQDFTAKQDNKPSTLSKGYTQKQIVYFQTQEGEETYCTSHVKDCLQQAIRFLKLSGLADRYQGNQIEADLAIVNKMTNTSFQQEELNPQTRSHSVETLSRRAK